MTDQSRNVWILKDDPKLVSAKQKDFFEDILEDRRHTSDIKWAMRTRDVTRYKYNKPRKPAEIKDHVLKSDRVKYAAEQVSEESGMPLTDVMKEAEEILDEMAHNLRIGAIRGFAVFLVKVMKQLFQRIYVNEEGIQKVRDMMKEYPVLLMPSHRSYLDFLLVSYVFFHYDLPLPVIAAAMDFQGMKFFGWLLRNSGAFYIRRSFGDDQLYWAVFTEYVQTHLCNGDSPVEFFVEGTRSRTQKSLSPKFGMLSASLEPYFKAHMPDIMVVPIAISYDRVLEEKLYAYELLGVPKPKESASGVLKARSVLAEDFGNVHMNFCDPVSIRRYSVNNIDRTVHSLAPRYIASLSFQEQALLQKLSYEIILQHLRNMAISPWSIIASVLLQNLEGISMKQLLKEVDWLKRQASNLGAYIDWPVNESAEAVIRHNDYQHKIIETITVDDNVKLLTDDTAPVGGQDKLMTSGHVNESAEAVIRHNVYQHKNIATITVDDNVELLTDDTALVEGQDKLMTSAAQNMMVCLYRNQLLNVFVRVAMIAVPINSCVQDTLNIEDLKAQYTLLVKLLEKEFIFMPGQTDQIDLVLANSADPDEMLHYAAFHLGLHGLPKYLFRVFQSTKATFSIQPSLTGHACLVDFEMSLQVLTHTCGVVVEDNAVLIKKSTNKYTTFFSQMFEPFLLGYWVMCRYLLSMQSGSHGKPLVKLPKAISKEAQMLSARLLREGAVKHMEILSLDMMTNSLHALYHLGAVHKEKREGQTYMYPNLVVLSQVTDDLTKFIDVPPLLLTTINVETKTVVVNAKL